MIRSVRLIATIACVAALGCGGRERATNVSTATSSGSLDASSGSTGSDSSDAIAPGPCEPTVEAGTASAGDAEVPLDHRAAPECCPTQRGPGPPNQPYPPGVASPGVGGVGACSSDADCDGGVNGRCFPFGGLVGPGGCSYDQCFTDSNCPSGTPCLCRSSPSDDSANVCVPGGNCVVDSDCGPGGYCSPSREGCEGPNPYYCHTALDECINDSDCPSVDGGELSYATSATCAYSLQTQRWVCEQLVCLPP
jgi:hypothetical protein